jgi:hypothetical protein
VAGALDEHDLTARGDGVDGSVDTGAQVLDDVTADERLREPSRDVDRAHELEGIAQAERRAHEDGVLVGRRVADERVALAHGLDEGRVQPTLDEGGEETQREGRLAAIHARGREVDLPHAYRVRRRMAPSEPTLVLPR